MKNILKSGDPDPLRIYRANNPTNTWEQFRRNKNRYIPVKDQLKKDQANLCAYCEIDLKERVSVDDVDDCRVEHFHPKSDDSSATNWHLKWDNLLATCHGGTQRKVVDAAERCTTPDHHCDAPKGDLDWDDLILNPLEIPSFPPIFSFARVENDNMSVNDENCDQCGVSIEKADNTITHLQLNAPKLCEMRKDLLDDMNDKMRAYLQVGLTIPEAQERLARAILRKDSNDHYPAFFSAIRSYLGSQAEAHLQAINYQG